MSLKTRTQCFKCNKNISASVSNKKPTCTQCQIKQEFQPTIVDATVHLHNKNTNSNSHDLLVAELRQLKLNKLTAKTKDFTNQLQLQWETEIAVQRANEIAQLGFAPTTLDNKKGGVAIWENIPEMHGWDITIKDSNPIIHNEPKEHVDVLFASIKILVPQDKIAGLQTISQTARYNPQTQRLTAGCHFIHASTATLYLVKLYIDGYLSAERAGKEYERTVMALATELHNAEKNTEKDDVEAVRDLLYESGIYERYILNGKNVFGSTKIQ